MVHHDSPGHVDDNLAGKVDDLNPTDDGEPSKQAHSPSNSGQLCFQVGLFIFSNQVKGGGIKNYLHEVKVCLYLKV